MQIKQEELEALKAELRSQADGVKDCTETIQKIISVQFEN